MNIRAESVLNILRISVLDTQGEREQSIWGRLERSSQDRPEQNNRGRPERSSQDRPERSSQGGLVLNIRGELVSDGERRHAELDKKA